MTVIEIRGRKYELRSSLRKEECFLEVESAFCLLQGLAVAVPGYELRIQSVFPLGKTETLVQLYGRLLYVLYPIRPNL